MKVLLLNVHSAQNLGDHGIMITTLRGIRSVFPEAQFTIAANHPQSWKRPNVLSGFDCVSVVGSLTSWVEELHNGKWHGRPWRMLQYLALLSLAVLAYRWFALRLMWGSVQHRQLLTAYYEADLVLGCGGGNLYAYRYLSPFFIWDLVALLFPLLLGKKVILLPQSFGPIHGRLQRALARWTLNRAKAIMAREPWSFDFVTEDLKVGTAVYLVPDLAFELVCGDIGDISKHRIERIGVTVMDRGAQLRSFGGQSHYEDTICTFLTRLAYERGAQIVLFCQCYGPSVDQDDRPATMRVYNRLREAGVQVALWGDLLTAEEAVDAYAGMDLMIGTRMHTAVFAICSATPILLISYQPKGCSVMGMCGLDRYCCDISRVNEEELFCRASELLDHSACWKSFLSARRDELRAQALRWTTLLLP